MVRMPVINNDYHIVKKFGGKKVWRKPTIAKLTKKTLANGASPDMGQST